MKLISWNVNSLRSAEEKFLGLVEREQPDVIMVQELRAHPNDLSLFLQCVTGYTAVFNDSGRPGYGGTAYYRKVSWPFAEVVCQTGDAILDMEGRTIVGRLGNIDIINFYVPNGSRGPQRQDYKMRFFQHMAELVKTKMTQGRSVVIGGDLNLGHTELDLYAPQENSHHSGFLPEERQWFGNLLGLGMVDTFRIFEKNGGHYTWWHMRDPQRRDNKGWRFDYFLVSQDLAARVTRSVILREIFGSDHCPILLELEQPPS